MSGSISTTRLPAYLSAMVPSISEDDLAEMQTELIKNAVANEKDIPASEVDTSKIEVVKEEGFVLASLLLHQVVDYFKLHTLQPARADDDDDGSEALKTYLFSVYSRHITHLMPIWRSQLAKAEKMDSLQELMLAIGKEAAGDKLAAYMKMLSGIVSMQVAESIRMTSATDVDLDESIDYGFIEETVCKLEDLSLCLLNPKEISYMLVDKSSGADVSVPSLDMALINRVPRAARMKKVGASLLLATSAHKKQESQAAYVFQSLWRERSLRIEKR